MSGSFLVSDALRKSVRPRRSIPGSATAPTEAAAKRVLARVPQAYSEKKVFYPVTTHANIFAAGIEAAEEPELRPLCRSHRASSWRTLRRPRIQ